MHVATRLDVDGASLPLNIRKVRWTQAFYGYDCFEITVSDPDLVQGSDPVADLTRDLSGKLGANLVLSISGPDGLQLKPLEGIITSVRGRYIRRGVEVTLEGIGAAGGLDQVRHTRVFQGKTWEEIVREVIGPIAGKLAGGGARLELGLWADVKVPFCCQYLETDFEFLRRLSAALGWVICAAGNELAIVAADQFGGIPGRSAVARLIPGSNCQEVEAAVHAVPTTVEAGGYQYYGEGGIGGTQCPNGGGGDAFGDEHTQEWTSQRRAQSQGLAAAGIQAGAGLFSSAASSHEGGVHWGQREFDTLVSRWTMRAAGEAARFSGSTWSLDLQLGGKAAVAEGEDLAVDLIQGEEILLTRLEHHIEADDYMNLFGGCPTHSPRLLDPAAYPPRDRFVTVPGRVSKSDDPHRAGRVQATPLVLSPAWIPETIPARLIHRSAGPDHGELMQPEVGDEVLLGFHPDAFDEPFVMGVLYNGTHKTLPDALPAHAGLEQGQLDSNDLKWFLTRGGCALVLDDTRDQERVLAITKCSSLELSEISGGPHMALTVREGEEPMCTLTFDKEGQVTLRSTNVLFDIKENVVVQAGKDFTVEAKGKIAMKAGTDMKLEAGTKLEGKAGTDMKLEAGTKLEGKAGTEMSLKAGTKLEGKAGTEAKVEALNTTVKGSTKLQLEGGLQSELKGGAMVTVQGGLVKIN